MNQTELEQLVRHAREAYEELQKEVRARWKRDLPIEELLFDRWTRAEGLGFGKGASIYHNSYVYGEVIVGENTWIGPYTVLDGTGKLTIGRSCSVSAGVHIYTHDTVKWALSGGKAPYEYAPVSIGDCCFIGSQTVIAKGVSIGNHSVIGACSFVQRDIPSYTLAVGVPCRPVGRVQTDEQGNVRLQYERV